MAELKLLLSAALKLLLLPARAPCVACVPYDGIALGPLAEPAAAAAAAVLKPAAAPAVSEATVPSCVWAVAQAAPSS